MTEYKICTYRACRVVFERHPNMADGTWNQVSRCPDCRKIANRLRSEDCKQPGTPLGQYEVKNETIDLFLYGS